MVTLRVIDFETTGMEPPAQVVEFGHCDLIGEPGNWTVENPVSRLCGGVESIPPEVRAIHHIALADVADCAHFDPAEVINGEGGPSVFVAHNLDFELKFLGDPLLPTICTLKAAYRVWPDAPGHSNGALRYWLEDQGLLSLDNATAMPPHRAGPDAYVTAHILKALLGKVTGREMVAWTKEPKLLPTCPLGKFRGFKWPDVEAGFLSWMLAQPTMEPDLKWNASRELERRKAA